MLLSRLHQQQSLFVNKGCTAGRLSALPLSTPGLCSSAAKSSRRSHQLGKLAAPRMPIRGEKQVVQSIDYDKYDLGDTLPEDYDKDTSTWGANRRAGVILHPTCLPGPNGIGEIGGQARAFVDWIASAGLRCWQILPMVPPDPMFYSPYSGTDSNAGNPLTIDLEDLISLGLLDKFDAPAPVPVANVDFEKVAEVKLPLISKAAARLLSDPKFQGLRDDMTAWRKSHAWIEDSAMFGVARVQPGLCEQAWWDWPEGMRFRQEKTMAEFRKEHHQAIEEFVATQFLFDKQWMALRAYANDLGIRIIGDMPIYVGGHSVDVWAHQELFELGPDGHPATVSGVPPDAFSETGQLWGSPLYKWEQHRKEGYSWWASRLGRAFELYDETRIDHFRGFAGYYCVDAKAETAMVGDWKKGPGLELFDALKAKLGGVPILAEDLGVITADVVQLREAIGAPGMVVLQFAWGGGPGNVHLPHMHYDNSYCYPGTHDNETCTGWFKDSATPEDKAAIKEYLGVDGSDIAWDLIRAAMQSVSNTAIFMMQDVMKLDNSARINTPGVAKGNWSWRIGDEGVWKRLAPEAKELRALAHKAFRHPSEPKGTPPKKFNQRPESSRELHEKKEGTTGASEAPSAKK